MKEHSEPSKNVPDNLSEYGERMMSQPLPIEGVERYTEMDLKMAFDAGRDHEWLKEYGNMERFKATTFDKWLATRKGSKSGE